MLVGILVIPTLYSVLPNPNPNPNPNRNPNPTNSKPLRSQFAGGN